nr:MAG TPA: hypothetical protein [Caudoviricetes sp.]
MLGKIDEMVKEPFQRKKKRPIREILLKKDLSRSS